ncbi:phosphopantetheine-binding protein [Actinosynnema sp. NPDC004786]
MHPDSTTLRADLVRLIVSSGDGVIAEDDLARADGSLRALNYSSLSYMRLIDAIENELGVYVDPEADPERFATVDSLVDLIRESADSEDSVDA